MKSKLLLLLTLLIFPVIAYSETLEIDPLLLKTSTKTNSFAKDFVKITNLGVDTIAVQITTSNPEFKLSSYGFGMLPGETKELTFNFYPEIPGVFINELFIRSEGKTFVLPAIVEVETPSVRFDSTVETLDAKRVFHPGDELGFSFTVFDLLEFVATDVDMEYYILNMKNELVQHDEGKINVRVQSAKTKNLKLPADITPGKYILVVKSRQGSSVGFSTLLFSVVEKPLVVEEFSLKTFCLGLVTGCLSKGVCIGMTVSVGFILFAILFIYLVEVIKLSRLPKKKIEKAIEREEKRKQAISLTKKVQKEAEEQKKEKELEKLEEAKRKKIIEEMLLKKKEKKQSITEKKLLAREIQKSKKERQKLIKEKKEEEKRRKKIEKMLKK